MSTYAEINMSTYAYVCTHAYILLIREWGFQSASPLTVNPLVYIKNGRISNRFDTRAIAIAATPGDSDPWQGGLGFRV